MKYSILALVLPQLLAAQNATVHSSTHEEREKNKAVVELYFHQVLDRRNFDLIRHIYADQATIHFPGKPTVKGIAEMEKTVREALSGAESFQTNIIDLVAEGDIVVARIQHIAKYSSGFRWQNRAGVLPPSIAVDQARWDAMTLFRIKSGKIVEQVICRDELAVLIQNGTVNVSPKR